MHCPMMPAAQGHQVVKAGLTAIRPMSDVVSVGPGRRTVAAREAAAAITEMERGADGGRDGAAGPA
jgi:hypothetical protein